MPTKVDNLPSEAPVTPIKAGLRSRTTQEPAKVEIKTVRGSDETMTATKTDLKAGEIDAVTPELLEQLPETAGPRYVDPSTGELLDAERLAAIQKLYPSVSETSHQSMLHATGEVTRPDLPSCYKGLPKPFPKGKYRLTDIIKTLPAEVFEKNAWKAWGQVGITLGSSAAGFVALAYAPWWTWPFIYMWLGTAVTGLFVIGHDACHRSFSRSTLVNDIVGLFIMLPLLYPSEPWRLGHNTHHSNTNNLEKDNAWVPFTPEWYYSESRFGRWIARTIKGPFFWAASVGHWLKLHFSLANFTAAHRPRCMISIAACILAGVFGSTALMMYGGFLTWVKFFLVPWLGYHFWMSAFTMIHHTIPHLPFVPESEWDSTTARISYTVHCEFPWWIERLAHYINVHVPHHLSTQIPSYNLRKAHEVLVSHWGEYMHHTTFSWSLLKDIVSQCHIYHPELIYTPFLEF